MMAVNIVFAIPVCTTLADDVVDLAPEIVQFSGQRPCFLPSPKRHASVL